MEDTAEQSAIIMVNNDLAGNLQETLVRQLFLHEVISGQEFDARVSADPNYPTIIHQQELRILVIRSFYDMTNRDLMDIVIFIKAGLASVEANKIGPPGLTLSVDKLYLHELISGVAPGQDTFTPNPNVQNNIYYPLHPHPTEKLNPFGTDK